MNMKRILRNKKGRDKEEDGMSISSSNTFRCPQLDGSLSCYMASRFKRVLEAQIYRYPTLALAGLVRKQSAPRPGCFTTGKEI